MNASLRGSLRFSWTFYTAGLFQSAMGEGIVWLTSCRSMFRRIPIDEWCKLLVISSKLDCGEVRTKAIEELTAKRTSLSAVDRIELGNKYDVTQWLPEAYAEAFVRDEHLTVEEGKKLGLEVTVKVLKGRDTCKRNGWRATKGWGGVTVSGDVTALVREIFPSLPAPPAQWPKKGFGSWF